MEPGQEVHPIRFVSQLYDVVIAGEIRLFQSQAAEPEIEQRSQNLARISRLGVDPDVQVLRVTRFRVNRGGIAACHKIAHLVLVEQRQKVAEVFTQFHPAPGPDVESQPGTWGDPDLRNDL
ncbi:MAG: hypothetical protein HY319_21005 [Armatimonadetes bacterium]|nr:hypothetical protein [Armatimonadota bacterium]